MTETSVPRKWKIFLLDDESTILEICKSYLKRDQFDIHTFSSPPAALESYKNGVVPDLIVTDLVMPDMHGTEYIKKMRELHFEQPIVIISGHADRASILKAVGLGVAAVIEKPFGKEDFLFAVKQALYSSVIMQSNKLLLTKYEDLVSWMTNLIQIYEERCIDAENRLFNATVAPVDKQKFLEFSKQIRFSEDLQTIIAETKKMVSDVKSSVNSATSFLVSR